MKIDILLSPPCAFLIFLMVSWIVYGFVSRIAPRGEKSAEKLSTYACGEDIPGSKFRFGYRLFFAVALFFTMMHVATLVVATLPKAGPIVFFGFVYLAMVFLAVMSLVTRESGW